MVTVVDRGRGVDRLAVAAAHVEAAVAHINNALQARIPERLSDAERDVADLRLLVLALADIRDALRNRPETSGR
jgi:hypothetical protein